VDTCPTPCNLIISAIRNRASGKFATLQTYLTGQDGQNTSGGYRIKQNRIREGTAMIMKNRILLLRDYLQQAIDDVLGT
jgi:hypothetical protein